MNTRTLVTLLVVVGLLVPVAGAAVNPQADSSPTRTASDTPSSSQGTTASNDTNYTRLYVDDRYKHLELKPGENDSITVTVENGEDHPVSISPSVYIPPRGERPIEKSWVSIEDGDTTLEAGEEREFEISVAIPEDAELNRYGGMIALTDEMVTYPGRPERPVHGVSVNVEVWREPTVRILSDRHAYTQVEAGDSFTREIVVENTGNRTVPVNPQLDTEDRRRRYPDDRETLDRSWLAIDAPNEIEPGDTETIEVTVSPPTDAERGDYRAELDLGLKDPARPDRESYWQEVDLRFQVWTQPENPFDTTFTVSEDAERITLELSAGHRYRDSSRTEPPSFDVTFVSPNGTEIDADRIRTTNRGHVNLGEDRRRSAGDDSTYATGGEQQTFRYRIDDPEAGSWSVKIMPDNVMRFGYEIVREESS